MNPKSRVLGRRDLYDTDGDALPPHVIRAAHAGSVVDMDICHTAIRDMLRNVAHPYIDRITLELDLDNGRWRTDTYDEAGRYADDIIGDWRAHGGPAFHSLHDTVRAYVDEIRHLASRLPERRSRHDVDFAFTSEHGTGPRSIFPHTRPPPYAVGEGHTAMPDGLVHPLLLHLASGRCGPGTDDLVPHRASGCAERVPPAVMRSPGAAARVPPYEIADGAKVDAVRRMVGEVGPDAAYLAQDHGRHSLMLVGDHIDTADAYRRATARHAEPVRLHASGCGKHATRRQSGRASAGLGPSSKHPIPDTLLPRLMPRLLAAAPPVPPHSGL